MKRFVISAWLTLIWSSTLLAQQQEPQPKNSTPLQEVDEEALPLGPFDHLGSNFVDSFVGMNLLWHGLAIGGTVVMVATDWDGDIQGYFWKNKSVLGDDFATGALIGGMFTPVLIPVTTWGIGHMSDDHELASGSAAALQSVGITFLVTTVLKLLTDRVAPLKNGRRDEGENWMTRTDDARDFGFNPFAFRGGFFWPSGHTATHMALASSLVAFFHEQVWLPFVAYPVVAIIGLAMIEGDHHWASDVLAGAFIGHAIGWTVGKRFRRQYDKALDNSKERQNSAQPGTTSWQVMPMASLQLTGVLFRVDF